MSMDSLDTLYILLEEKRGKRKDEYSQLYFNKTEQEVLPGGTLLRLLRKIKPTKDYSESLLLLERVEYSEVQVTCKRSEIEKISWEIPYIASIPSLKERLEVFKDKEWLNNGKKLKENDSVYVKIKDEQVQGTVRFKREIGDAKGIIFGIELKEAKGTSDGVYRDIPYFKTAPNHAIFTTLNKIQIRRDGWSKKSRLRADVGGEGLYKPEECNNALKMGERVVWISDNGPKKGTVRWCGVLPDDPSDNITVGVEFDEPVGTGTGKYKDKRLFYTRLNYASLIPLMGLMREDEYEDPFHDLSPQMQLLVKNSSTQQEDLIEQYRRGLQIASYPEDCKRSENNLSNPSKANSYQGQYQLPKAPPDVVPHLSVYKRNAQDFEKERIARDAHEEKTFFPLQDVYTDDSTRSKMDTDSANDLRLGDSVQVKLKDPLYGIVRWIGIIANKKIAGLEMEKELSGGTDGTYMSQRIFYCSPSKALFVPLYKCVKDRRSPIFGENKQEFGGAPTPVVEGDVPPAEIVSDRDYKELCGKHRGIQGHHNSCYLDATLFSMFYFTTVFDFIFNRPSNAHDLAEYPKVQRVLREKIVNPLRRYHYVRADNVLELRELLDKLGTVPGMMGEEKDPEEFLNALLSQIMKADPLLHLSTGEHSFFYQLFMEKDENLLLPTTQKLVELSFLQMNVKLKEVPSCLMIQMPRFGKDYKMFPRIVPSLQLDITHILENRPRDCIVCGGLAMHECKDCYQVHGPGLNTTAFCDNCVKKTHQHQHRRNHKPQPLVMSPEFLKHYEGRKNAVLATAQEEAMDNLVAYQPETMELFAVICIQTSHYVSFVKCGSGKDAPWVFFDSMADRMGEQGGYNIPEVVHVPELSNWLSEKNISQLLHKGEGKDLPEHLRRLLCDGYMCMYQSPTVKMFQ